MAQKKQSKTEQQPQAPRGLQKSREGVVVSNKMTKTVIVAVVRQVKHEAYGKYIRKTSKHFAHDEKNECQIGDRVRIVETRPMSKMKRWKVESVLAKADVTA
jgi:small subunit ribosomal protein S17